MTASRTNVRGFSLLELIIVLVIIGVMLAAITISLSDRRVDNLKLESQRLHALIQLASDQAVISNRELGLLLDDKGYQFLHLADDKWQLIPQQSSRRFVSRPWPEDVYSRIEVSGLYNQAPEDNRLLREQNQFEENQQEKFLLPQILMLSSAEVTPFKIRLGWDNDSPTYMEIRTAVDGTIELKGPVYEPLNSPWDLELQQ